MGSTLEKLLSIQGATEQQSMEMLINVPQALQEREKGAELVEPPPTTENARKGPPGPRESVSPPAPVIKAFPAMLEAWRMAFKTFTKYAPALRHAANQDDDNAAAVEAFSAAAEEVSSIHKIGGDAEILALHVYGMLEDIYKQG